jgi:hypothetical protein
LCESVASLTARIRNLRLHVGALLHRSCVDQAVSRLKGDRTKVRVRQTRENPVRKGKITFTLGAAQRRAALADGVLAERGGAAHAPPPARRTHSGAQWR